MTWTKASLVILQRMPIGIIYSNNPVIPQFGLRVGGFIFFVPGYPITAQILAHHSSF